MSSNESPTFGKEIFRYAEVTSTNDVAFDLAAAGKAEGTVVIAGRQTQGRGRRGGEWFSPPGRNLYFSVLLFPERERREWVELPWVAAGAVAEVLVSFGIGGVSLKYPNDVLSEGKKLAGVLLESRSGISSSVVVAGVGLNVNLRREELPPELTDRAASIYIVTGRETDIECVFQRVCRVFEDYFFQWQEQGGEAVRRRILKRGVGFAAGA